MTALRDQDAIRCGAGTVFSALRWWPASFVVMAIALFATGPTVDDLGLTWDEPAYRYSQMVSAQWWRQLGNSRAWADVEQLLDPDALLYYWPYGRNGINLHPPLAGQLSLLTHWVFGHWVKDIPSRRLASVFEYSLAITILFGFLGRRYGAWVAGVAAGALLLMPRVYGDGHIASTDMLCLLIWGATAIAFWNALHEECGRWWRCLVGVLLGLAFDAKMVAVAVILPLVVWLVAVYVPTTANRRGSTVAWIEGFVSSAVLLCPLILAVLEIVRLSRLLPPPGETDLFIDRPQAHWSGIILACPLVIWVVRRIVARVWRAHPISGLERPGLETWAAALAFAPIVAWLGNPLWWRETLPRLAHYMMLNAARRGALPDIPIFYRGQIYLFSLPWENAWLLIGITVPAGIFAAALAGLAYAVRVFRHDRLPIYFAVHLITLPVVRMLGTPAHDGVRLFLPAFFFVAALAGWGTVWIAGGLERLTRRRKSLLRWIVVSVVLGPAAWQLVRIHPYELSYYNELIGGPRGAWESGFELSYWYEAFNGSTIAQINERLPHGATIDFLNRLSRPRTFAELQALGQLRGDLKLGLRSPVEIPYVWLLTQDSKATAFTRLLFAMKPWYASHPRQLDGLRIATVADPRAVSRAWALQLLLDAPSVGIPEPAAAPDWVRANTPWLSWFWGDGVPKFNRMNIYKQTFEWAARDPEGLRSAARAVAGRQSELDGDAVRLLTILKRHDPFDPPGQLASERLLRGRPEALLDAVEILITRLNDVRNVMQRRPYTSDASIGGFLDREVP